VARRPFQREGKAGYLVPFRLKHLNAARRSFFFMAKLLGPFKE
jgi:hypothetical protein